MNRPAKVTQGEIARAIRAAKQAGGMLVEIDPDGTIRIKPISPQHTGQDEPHPVAPRREAVF